MAISGAGPAPLTGPDSPLDYAIDLVWADEFTGDQLNVGNWNHDIGGGWGNNESQYYKEENVNLSEGFLTITAKQEDYGGGTNHLGSRLRVYLTSLMDASTSVRQCHADKASGPLWALGSTSEVGCHSTAVRSTSWK